MIDKKRGLLIISILLVLILLNGCDFNDEENYYIDFILDCAEKDNNDIIYSPQYQHFGDDSQSLLLNSYHLCLKNGYVSCLKAKDYGVTYCSKSEIDKLELKMRQYGNNLPGLVTLQEIFDGDEDPIDIQGQYFNKVDDLFSKWRTIDVDEAFPEEKLIISNNDENENIGIVEEKISEKFELINNRNVIDLNEVSMDEQQPEGTDDYEEVKRFYDLEMMSMIIPCHVDFKNFIIEFRPAGDLSQQYYDADISEAYICLDTGSDDKTRRWKWVRFYDDFPATYDQDGDNVPIFFDCDDNDPYIFGDFVKYTLNFVNDELNPEINGLYPTPICGDGKKNTCGILTDEEEEHLEDCNNNRESCESDCLWPGNECVFKEDVGCCGGNDLEDHGEIFEGQLKNYLCLNRHLINEDIPEENRDCKENWCFLNPTEQDYDFNIFTVRVPGEPTYDVISDREGWVFCNSEEDHISELGDSIHYEPNKFYCYNEGNRWSIAECCENIESVECLNSEIKVREKGDGTYKIPFDDETNRLILQYDPDLEEQDDYGYFDVYGQELPNFVGYDHLEFFMEFTLDNAEGVRVNLEVRGPKNVYFNQDVLGYVVNGATYQKGKKMKVKVPISDWGKVNWIRFTDSHNVGLKISNLQLTKNESMTCSGDFSIRANSWIEDFDYWDQDSLGDINGKLVCDEENFGMFWLGPEVENESLRCCGDDVNEYYVGEEGSCWNSQSINNEPITSVMINLTYNQGKWNYNYSDSTIKGSYIINYEDGVDTSNLNQSDTFPDTTTNLLDSPKQIKVIKIRKYGFEEAHLENIVGGKVEFQFFDNNYELQRKTRITPNDLHEGMNTIYIVGNVDQVERNYQYKGDITETLTFTCTSSVCSFPLKGDAPYNITNLFPEKYDIYYAYRIDNSIKKIPIGGEKEVFGNDGWLMVENLPLQIIYNSTGNLVGCGNVEYLKEISGLDIEQDLTANPNNFCSVEGSYFCDYNYNWSSEPARVLKFGDDLSYHEEEDVESKDRIHFTQVVFGRNLLLNPWLGMEK